MPTKLGPYLLLLAVVCPGCKAMGGVAGAMGKAAFAVAKTTATVATVAAKGVAVAGKAAARAAPVIASSVARGAVESSTFHVPVIVEVHPQDIDTRYAPEAIDDAIASGEPDSFSTELEAAGRLLPSCLESGSGKVEVTIRVDANGRVAHFELTPASSSSEEACMTEILLSLQFSSHPTITTVTFVIAGMNGADVH